MYILNQSVPKTFCDTYTCIYCISVSQKRYFSYFDLFQKILYFRNLPNISDNLPIISDNLPNISDRWTSNNRNQGSLKKFYFGMDEFVNFVYIFDCCAMLMSLFHNYLHVVFLLLWQLYWVFLNKRRFGYYGSTL